MTRTSAAEFDRMKRPMVLDLIAYFKLLERRVHERLEEAVKKGWTPDQFIKSFDEII